MRAERELLSTPIKRSGETVCQVSAIDISAFKILGRFNKFTDEVETSKAFVSGASVGRTTVVRLCPIQNVDRTI